MKKLQFCGTLLMCLGAVNAANACTGITLKATDNSVIAARTMDWSGAETNNMYVIVPRGHSQQSLLPDGKMEGLEFSALYGYAGIATEQPEFVIDGTNEAGLSAALFYFPNYGKYEPYNDATKDISLADFQVVSWILARFATIDQVKQAINDVRIINVDPSASTVHWRITDATGRQVVLEIVNGVPNFYENEIGVLTNSPGFQWQMTNLNNYVNLHPGGAGPTEFGPIELRSFGSGSGFRGLPGDFTPPSRFVRAAFLKTYALPQTNAFDAVTQAFHILNNFDIPSGIQFPVGKSPTNMPAATQWTIATDVTNRTIYYHTMYDRSIRKLDMDKIDFANITFQYHPLDETKSQPTVSVTID